MEEGGIQTHVKDMSLEKGFPTIGLLCDFEVFNTNKSSFSRIGNLHGCSSGEVFYGIISKRQRKRCPNEGK
ncbi:MAG: hypothetical protein ACTSPN_16670 [Promethearchaeota archaeon]